MARISRVLGVSANPCFLLVSFCVTLRLPSRSGSTPHHPVKSRSATRQHAVLNSILDPIIEKAVADHEIPRSRAARSATTAASCIARPLASRSLEPTRETMTADTIFDLASLTKCIATATSVMKLVQDGRVRLNRSGRESICRNLRRTGKQDITVRELLTHYSGLALDLDLSAPWQGRDTAFTMAMQQDSTPIRPAASSSTATSTLKCWASLRRTSLRPPSER